LLRKKSHYYYASIQFTNMEYITKKLQQGKEVASFCDCSFLIAPFFLSFTLCFFNVLRVATRAACCFVCMTLFQYLVQVFTIHVCIKVSIVISCMHVRILVVCILLSNMGTWANHAHFPFPIHFVIIWEETPNLLFSL